MKCQSCKEEILDNSTFCPHCGARIGEQATFNYEYKDYTWSIESVGTYGKLIGEDEIVRDHWRSYQVDILPDIQKWLDEGWEPISEIGPSALVVREEPLGCLTMIFDSPRYNAQRNVIVEEFRVKMRRKQQQQLSSSTPKPSAKTIRVEMVLRNEKGRPTGVKEFQFPEGITERDLQSLALHTVIDSLPIDSDDLRGKLGQPVYDKILSYLKSEDLLRNHDDGSYELTKEGRIFIAPFASSSG